MPNFPRDYWQESNTVVGHPEAGEWGGLYLKLKHHGKRKVWLLDQKKSNIPSNYPKFMGEVVETINTMQ